MLAVDAPTGLEASLLVQPENGDRSVIHLVYAAPERRAIHIDIIEDTALATDVNVSLRSSSAPDLVNLQPQDAELELTFEGGYVRTSVPEIRGHQLVVFE